MAQSIILMADTWLYLPQFFKNAASGFHLTKSFQRIKSKLAYIAVLFVHLLSFENSWEEEQIIVYIYYKEWVRTSVSLVNL